MTKIRHLLPLIGVLLLVVAACSDDSRSDAAGPLANGPASSGTATANGDSIDAGGPRDCPDPTLPPGTELGDAELRFTSTCRSYVRTPETAFAGIEDFPYEPHYADVDGMRMAYVEAGPADGEVVLLLHGQPSWSYLYRKMIPVLADAGYRVIALDMMGMGRSDKPIELDDYSYHQHIDWVSEFLETTDLTDVTVFVHDWGSLIGLRVVADHPERFARVVVANGRLPLVPAGMQIIELIDPPVPDSALTLPLPCDDERRTCFERWAGYALTGTAFHPAEVLQWGTAVELTDAELAAYDAPFPDRIWMSGARTFPSLINTLGEAPTNEAAGEFFDRTEMPILTLFGRLDGNLGSEAVQAEMAERPGAEGQAHHSYPDAAHFIQEDKGVDLAERVVAFIQANPVLPEDPVRPRSES